LDGEDEKTKHLLGSMKYVVIGGGISGLSVANLLKKDNEVVVLEADNRPGGMIKCDIVDGCLYHRTGGHVFNSKRKDIMDWFWSFFSQEEDFTKAFRNASVFMPEGNALPYPIENHIYKLDKLFGEKVIKELLQIAKDFDSEPTNFEDFLRGRFGQTLYDLYFQPYNYKVWRRDLSKVPLLWLKGKLPMPTVEEILFNNIYQVDERAFVHSSFYYPKKGGSQFIADTFAKDLNVIYNCRVDSIKRNADKWVVNDIECDRIVFCGNIKQIPALFNQELNLTEYDKRIEELEYHGTTSVFCEIENNPYSWIYMPSREYESHRIICTGNFSGNNNSPGMMTGTIEFTDYISKEDIIDNLQRIPLSPKYISHHYEKYSYPIQGNDTRMMIENLKRDLEVNNVYLCGRVAEWEYFNMDAAMGSALDLYQNKFK
jgi:protoporphyrinogen oxidase